MKSHRRKRKPIQLIVSHGKLGRLQIPDEPNWEAYMLQAVDDIEFAWRMRHHDDLSSCPQTREDFDKAMDRIANYLWFARGHRKHMFYPCYTAWHRSLDKGLTDGHFRYDQGRIMMRKNGRWQPLSKYRSERMIIEGWDHTRPLPNPSKHDPKDRPTTIRNYARVLTILYRYCDDWYATPKGDRDMLRKHCPRDVLEQEFRVPDNLFR